MMQRYRYLGEEVWAGKIQGYHGNDLAMTVEVGGTQYEITPQQVNIGDYLAGEGPEKHFVVDAASFEASAVLVEDATGGTPIPHDDEAPQSTEGTEVVSHTIPVSGDDLSKVLDKAFDGPGDGKEHPIAADERQVGVGGAVVEPPCDTEQH